jgi:hypothetical protein
MSLLAEMAALLPGRLSKAGNTSRLVFEVDGCWLDARAREAPMIEVFIRTLDIRGFELEVEPGGGGIRVDVKRHWGSDAFGNQNLVFDEDEVSRAVAAAAPALSFERNFEVESNDDELAALWLDAPARSALVDALWLIPDVGLISVDAVPRGYQYVVARGEVLVKRGSELDPARLARAVRAGGMLAARPHRIARAWLEVARGLGGTTTNDRWDLGAAFALTIERSPVTVRIDNLGEPLRTRARAVRLGATEDDDPWAPVAGLLAAAAPDHRSLSAGEVELRWKGLMMDPARLGPAVEICARLAAPSIAATGPYR